MVPENGLEFLIRMFYPGHEIDAQLEAYREESGVLVHQASMGWSHQGAAACSSLPISNVAEFSPMVDILRECRLRAACRAELAAPCAPAMRAPSYQYPSA